MTEVSEIKKQMHVKQRILGLKENFDLIFIL